MKKKVVIILVGTLLTTTVLSATGQPNLSTCNEAYTDKQTLPYTLCRVELKVGEGSSCSAKAIDYSADRMQPGEYEATVNLTFTIPGGKTKYFGHYITKIRVGDIEFFDEEDGFDYSNTTAPLPKTWTRTKTIAEGRHNLYIYGEVVNQVYIWDEDSREWIKGQRYNETDSVNKPVIFPRDTQVSFSLTLDDSEDLPRSLTITKELNLDNWVEVTSPNGGEKWEIGEEHIIDWEYGVLLGCYERFNIYYKKKNGSWLNIVSDVESPPYSWNTTSISRGFYKIKVELWCDTDLDGHGDSLAAEDTSDDWFEMPKTKASNPLFLRIFERFPLLTKFLDLSSLFLSINSYIKT